LIAPVIPGPSTPADFRPFVSPDDRFNFGPFNFLQIPVERFGLFGNLRYELSDAVNFATKAIWNKRKSKNQAAPLPFGIGQAAGITPVLDATTVDATNPFNPFGVTLDTTNMDFIFRPDSTRRSTPSTGWRRSTACSSSPATTGIGT
jgi:iron complex outermembrane receptor protein